MSHIDTPLYSAKQKRSKNVYLKVSAPSVKTNHAVEPTLQLEPVHDPI